MPIQLSDLPAAEAGLARAVALDPDGGKVLEALAIVALLSGDASEARALVHRADAVGSQVQPNLSKALEQPRDRS